MPEPDAPALLETLCRRAEDTRASDIHLHLQHGTAAVAFRLDGLLVDTDPIGSPLAERLFGRIKFLAKLKTYQQILPQDGRIDRADIGTSGDLRVSTYPTVQGEKIVLRLFGSEPSLLPADLGLPGRTTEALAGALGAHTGLILFTGPAGSGKTTTIYACLRHLSQTDRRHVITVEDPVEQVIPGIMQTEINEVRGLTFARACRHLLRQDPQVLVIGEIRDDETANLAIRAALTGHLVISTLHAGSCRGVAERLLVMCEDRHAAASVLTVILNQRLIRGLCAACRGRGCDACLGTGYLGRTPIAEHVVLDDALRARLFAQGAEVLRPDPTMEAAARERIAAGCTDEAEIRRALGG